MKKLKRQLRILLITRISIWIEHEPCGIAWSACSRFLAQLKRELAIE